MKRLVGDISLYVEEKGVGNPSLVFLHYWGGTRRSWNQVVAEFAGSHHTVTTRLRLGLQRGFTVARSVLASLRQSGACYPPRCSRRKLPMREMVRAPLPKTLQAVMVDK